MAILVEITDINVENEYHDVGKFFGTPKRTFSEYDTDKT